MKSWKPNPKYVDICLLVSIAILTSVIMQLSMYLFGSMMCEHIGLQAENTFCQLYFSVDFDDSMEMKNISRLKRWCLLYNNGQNGPRGMLCMRADSLLSLYRNKNQHLLSEKEKKGKKARIASTHKANHEKPKATIPPINLQEIKSVLPLIELKDKSLTPKIWVTRKRQNVDLVMTLSIYKLLDTKNHALFTTLDTLLFNIPPVAQHTCLIMVCITEMLDDGYVEELVSAMMIRYTIQIETGLVEILAPRNNFYVSMFTHKSLDGRNKTKRKMMKQKKQNRDRRKQCMDLIFMMIMAYKRGKYYLQLGHNVLTRRGFLPLIYRTLDGYQSHNWTALSFSDIGIIGKMVHTDDLLGIATYLSRLDMNKPAEYHIENFVKDKQCGLEATEVCGADSSLEKFFQTEDELFQYINSNVTMHTRSKDKKDNEEVDSKRKHISAVWASSSLNSKIINTYLPCTSIRTTRDILPLLSSNAKFLNVSRKTRHERIAIGFNPPISISRVKMTTGIPDSPHSKHRLGEDSTVWSFTEKLMLFSHIGNFNSKGGFEMTLDRNLREVHVLEILLGSVLQERDILIHEVALTLNCRQSTRISISSSADVKPTGPPTWYTPPPQSIPRTEGGVLISF